MIDVHDAAHRRCDRNNDTIATVELHGKRFEAAQSAFLSSDRWQDVTWQFAGPDDQSISTKNWIRLDHAGTSGFDQPGKVRLVDRACRLGDSVPDRGFEVVEDP